MSLSTNPVKKIFRTVDPRIDFEEQPLYVIGEGGSQVSYRVYQSTSYSTTNITVPTQQSPDIAIASKVFMRCRFKVTMTGTVANTGGLPLNLGHFGPRFMPFNSVITSATMTINQSTFNQSINQYFDALCHYNNCPEEMGWDLSAAPSFLDQYQNYNDAYYVPSDPNASGYGSSLNALGGIGECSKLAQPRGGFPMTITGNVADSTQWTIEFETYEPVLISPLTWGHHNHKAFIGVNSMNFTFNFDSNLSRVVSFNNADADGNPIVNNLQVALVEITAPPSLEFIYITPRANQKIEPLQRYPFNNIQMVVQDTNVSLPAKIPANAPQEFKYTLNTQTLIGVPQSIYIFARRRNADRTFLTTDTFCRIAKISMQFDNQQGILAQASEQQLYLMSAENGYNQSWADWHTYQGSILKIDFSKDVPLNAYCAQGSLKNIQFQFELTIENLNTEESLSPAIYTIISYDGVFSVDASTLTIQETNIVSPADVINSQVLQRLPYNAIDTYASSKFGGKLSDVGNHVRGFARKAADAYMNIPDPLRQMGQAIAGDALRSVAPGTAKYLLPAVKGLLKKFIGPDEKIFAESPNKVNKYVQKAKGSGYTEEQIYKTLMGSGMIRKIKKANKGKKGGKKLTKADLRKLAY